MILLDLSGTIFATIAVNLKGMQNEIDEDFLRHLVLNSIRATRKKFADEYGELVIACDSHQGYWRRKAFPYYKARRKEGREASDLNWNQIFESVNKIRDEIEEHFPYRVVNVVGAEADDVIAVLTRKYHTQEPILIVSRDKDFIQLQSLPNVKQWNAVQKKWVRDSDPKRYLQEHIIRGDSGDGIGNVLQGDADLVNRVRAKPITQKRIDAWLFGDPKLTMDATTYRNWLRNFELISFERIPQEIVDAILTNYEAQNNRDRSKLFKYFISKRLPKLMENLSDF